TGKASLPSAAAAVRDAGRLSAGPQLAQEVAQLLGHRRAPGQLGEIAVGRQLQEVRVQEHAAQALVAQGLLLVAQAVLAVAGHRVAQRQGVDADLVGAAGVDLDLAQGGVAIVRLRYEARTRGLAFLVVDLDETLAAFQPALHQRGVDLARPALQAADQQREVALVRQAVAEGALGPQQRRPGLGEQQHAAGVAVEAVGQFQELVLAPAARRLDHAVGDAGAAVRGQARRLADGQVVRVLIDDGLAQLVQHRVRSAHRRAALGHPHRGDAHLLALHQLALGLGAAAADAHLAGAQQPVDVRLGHARQALEQEVVDALAVLAGADRHLAHAGRHRLGPGGGPLGLARTVRPAAAALRPGRNPGAPLARLGRPALGPPLVAPAAPRPRAARFRGRPRPVTAAAALACARHGCRPAGRETREIPSCCGDLGTDVSDSRGKLSNLKSLWHTNAPWTLVRGAADRC